MYKTIGIDCPSCDSSDVKCLGGIPSHNVFAGNVLDYSFPGGFLYKCGSCYLYFRYPRLTKAELNKLYVNGNPDGWRYRLEDRKDWQIAISYLSRYLRGDKVLDIGCFDGGFLKYLGSGFERFGVEINKEAAGRAEREGITIIAKDIDELNSLKSRFDATVGFDVIEHVEDPMLFLDEMSRLTVRGGVIIVSSGNSRAPTWRLMGSKYWYCTIAEHISFINPDWIYNAAESLGLGVEHVEVFSHAAGGRRFIDFIRESRANILYKISPNLLLKLRRLKGRVKDGGDLMVKNNPPSWMNAKDHIIVVFRKP
jgi:2-polyprenyl-3-methyl-5-hydroxy-6-metoxy-1,4-benzoquinol methylase